MMNLNLRSKLLTVAAHLPADDDDASEATALAALAEMRAAVDQLIAERVRVARSLDTSWSVIGDALGVSKQAAHERYAGQQ